MDVANLAYTAGIIDGEGCIGIYAQLRTPKNKKGYQVRVSVNHTNGDLMHWLARTYGGKVYFEARNNPKWKHRWAWILTGKGVSVFLELIYPYLRLKKAQAELALKFQGNRRGKGYPLTEDELNLDKMQRTLMNELNRRGK